MSTKLPFTRIKEFTVGPVIQEGPYTLVCHGTQTNLNRPVIIKLLKPHTDAELKKRFEREARVYAKLNDPNIVSVYALGKHAGYLYIILEYVEGTNLKALLERHGALDGAIVWSIVDSVLQALGHAAQKGIVHRDIKPANILLDTGGRVKVADFGLAIILEEPGVTVQQAVIGTPAYMAPEQVTGDNLDERTDLFGLGAVLYEMLTGKQAFGSENYSVSINKVLNEEPDGLDEESDEKFRGFLQRCLKKQKSERWPSVAEALSAWEKLGTVYAGLDHSVLIKNVRTLYEDTSAIYLSTRTESGKSGRKKKYGLILLVLVLVVFVIFKFFYPEKAGEVNKTSFTSIDSVADIKSNLLKEPRDSVLKFKSKAEKQPPGKTEDESSSKKPGRDTVLNVILQKENFNRPETSFVDLSLKPWASVFVDGVLKDSLMSSGEIALKAGTHSLTFNHPYFDSKQMNLDLKAGERRRINWSFLDAVGYVNLEVRPWARVYINDKYFDTTPLKAPLMLSSGQKILELRHPEFQTYRRSIQVTKGDTLNLQVTLNPE